jgi:hypothetical protein
MPKKNVDERWWEISRLAARAVYVGRVRAGSAEEAVEVAIEQFAVGPELRSRIVARPG